MVKAIGSKVWLDSNNDIRATEFYDCIKELLEIEDVKNLDKYVQHFNTSRLQHSINVSYYTFLACKKLGLDYRSGARGALLHDLYLYDWRQERQPEGYHAKAHPKVALRNAKKNIELNQIEIDAIVKHMWPLTFERPRYKEALLVCMLDKYCALLEFGGQSLLFYICRSEILRKLFFGEEITPRE